MFFVSFVLGKKVPQFFLLTVTFCFICSWQKSAAVFSSNCNFFVSFVLGKKVPQFFLLTVTFLEQ